MPCQLIFKISRKLVLESTYTQKGKNIEGNYGAM